MIVLAQQEDVFAHKIADGPGAKVGERGDWERAFAVLVAEWDRGIDS